jgi:hypothetical protein
LNDAGGGWRNPTWLITRPTLCDSGARYQYSL